MTDTETPALLVLSGPVGVGKTTVAEEASNLLVEQGISHTLIDLDALAETYPRPADDPFHKELALRNLRDVWKNCRKAGSRNLIVPRVIEDRADLAAVARCIPRSRPVLCRLRADRDTLVARIRRRELGSGLAWHEARALELARTLDMTGPADFVVETDGRSVADIASEIVPRVDWTIRP